MPDRSPDAAPARVRTVFARSLLAALCSSALHCASSPAGPGDGAPLDARDATTTTDATPGDDASHDDALPLDAPTTDATADAAPADAPASDAEPADPTLGAAPRPLAPLSSATVTSQQPTLRWALTASATGALVDICRDRACATLEQQLRADGSFARPDRAFAPGVHFWRLRARGHGAVGTMVGPVWSFWVGHRSATVDTSAGVVSDFNGDGVPDIAASAGSSSPAHVAVFTTGGASLMPAGTLTAPAGGANFAYLVASVGDVNGDGYTDLVVADANAAGSTLLYLYPGSATGLSAAPAVTLTGQGAPFSPSVAGATDFNGDGYADVAVTWRYGGMGFSETADAIFLGGPDGLSSTRSVPIATPPGDTMTGRLLALPAGDVNGDGLGDFAIGTFTLVGGTPFVMLGARTGTGPLVTLALPAMMTYSSAVYPAGDVDGDGRSDLVLVRLAAGASTAHLFRGAPGGVDATPQLLATPALPAFAGHGGDVNGDGFSDFMVRTTDSGAGRVAIFFGGASGLSTTPQVVTPPASVITGFGLAMTVTDTNGDGFADVLIAGGHSGSPPNDVYLLPGSATLGAPAATPVISDLTSYGYAGAPTLVGAE